MRRVREYSMRRDITGKKNVMEEAVWYYYNVNYQAAVVRDEDREIDIQIMEEHA